MNRGDQVQGLVSVTLAVEMIKCMGKMRTEIINYASLETHFE